MSDFVKGIKGLSLFYVLNCLYNPWRSFSTYLAMTNYDSTTASDYTGWSAAKSSGVFALWLIFPFFNHLKKWGYVCLWAYVLLSCLKTESHSNFS